LPGMPLEADRLETLGGLLDKQLVFADGTERPQGEWLKVGAAPQERRSLPQAGQKRASAGIPLPQRPQKEVARTSFTSPRRGGAGAWCVRPRVSRQQPDRSRPSGLRR
jgi:hypothetical protein